LKTSELLEQAFGDELVLSRAADIVTAVRQVAFDPGEVMLDCSSLTRVDLAGLQLLVAAGKSAELAGAALRIEKASEALQDAARRAGLRF
jgi:anti-anti-sigma regulatory factor